MTSSILRLLGYAPEKVNIGIWELATCDDSSDIECCQRLEEFQESMRRSVWLSDNRRTIIGSGIILK